MNRQRRRRPQPDSAALQGMPAPTPPPAQLVAEKENRERLWEAAASALGQEPFAAVWLYYVEEMPVREVARVIGRSPIAVKTMLFRARKRLFSCLQAFRPESFESETIGSCGERCAAPAETTHG